MENTFNRPKYTTRSNPYLTQKIMSASPEQLVVYIYDTAIAACGRKDRIKALQAINLLIKSLNFEDREVALRFYQVYNTIIEFINRKRFDEAKELVSDLRATWVKAMGLE